MKMIGETIDDYIKKYVDEVLSKSDELPDIPNDLISTDNIGEVIEKSIILLTSCIE